MFLLIAILGILLSVVLIAMVLLQPSKSGAVGGMLGTVSSNLGSTFGSRRTLDFLAKGTTYVAAALGVICILANVILGTGGEVAARPGSATQGKIPGAQQQSAPAQPGAGQQGGAQQPAAGQQSAGQPQGNAVEGQAPAGTPAPANGSAPAGQPAAPPAGAK